jgi:hypothetical protein
MTPPTKKSHKKSIGTPREGGAATTPQSRWTRRRSRPGWWRPPGPHNKGPLPRGDACPRRSSKKPPESSRRVCRRQSPGTHLAPSAAGTSSRSNRQARSGWSPSHAGRIRRVRSYGGLGIATRSRRARTGIRKHGGRDAFCMCVQVRDVTHGTSLRG